MLSLEGILATVAGVFVLAMIAWDWTNEPSHVRLPPDDDEWHDWPHV